METYLDALLKRHTAMSRNLMEENAELSALLILTEPAGQPAQADTEAAAPVRASESAPDGSQTAAAALLAELDALQATRSRIPLLRQTLSEQRQRQAMELQTVDVMRQRPENTVGGLTGSYRQTLTADGIAGAPTGRSMLEISRYFERDARRYG